MITDGRKVVDARAFVGAQLDSQADTSEDDSSTRPGVVREDEFGEETEVHEESVD